MSFENDSPEKSTNGQGYGFPIRYILPIMGFLAFWMLSAMRLNMSLTIVAMVNSTAVFTMSEAAEGNVTLPTEPSKVGHFLWSPKTQGTILGSFFWTFGIGCMIGGRLSEVFGSKKVFGIGMLIHSLFTLATPLSAMYHWHALVSVRAFSGFFHGIVFPGFAPIVRKWIPASERSLVLSVVYGGLHFGAFFTIFVSGYLCDSDILGGWPSVYYFFGTISVFWCLLFKFLVYETPSEHPWISDEELHYILDSKDPSSRTMAPPIPWRAILISPSVWAICMAAFAVRWAQYHFHTVHPIYMATVLKYSITNNGVFSSLPHLLLSVVVLASGSVSDFLRRKKSMSITMVHKIFVTIGMFGYIICVLGVIGAGYDIMWNTTLLIIAMGFTGISYVGETVAPLDMSPHFSGTLMGMCAFLSTGIGYIMPIIVGVLTEEEQTMTQWRKIFYISIGVICVCTIGFDVMGSAEQQPWDGVDGEMEKNKTEGEEETKL